MILALAAMTVPILGTGVAGAAVTSPAEDAVWYTGETKSITWEALEGAGTAALSLYNGSTKVDADPVTAGVQDITTGLVAATATSYSWTIPATLAAGSGLTIKIAGAGTTPWAGSEVVSDEFAIAASGVSDVTPTGDVDIAVTSTTDITWKDNGATGATVNIDLLRNDGASSGATTTSIAKKLAKADLCNSSTHVCTYEWTVAAKTALDTTTGSYKIRVTPVTGAAGKSAAAFSVIDRSLSFTEWSGNLTPKAGEPVTIAWTAAGDLGSLSISAIPSGEGALPVIVNKKVAASEGSYTWYPSVAQAGKTYTIKLTSTIKDASKAAFTDTSTHTVAVGAATAFNLEALAGLTAAVDEDDPSTAALGTPITVSWNFGEVLPEDEEDPLPALAALPVDIVLLDSANKVTKIATAQPGAFDEDGIALREFTFRPSGKLKAGDYRVKVTVTGTTDAAFTKTSPAFTLAAPTTLDITAPSASASLERGGSYDVTWTLGADSELPVNVSLLNTTTSKAIVLAKGIVGAEGDGKGKVKVTIPAKGLTAGSTYKIVVASTDLKTLTDEVAVVVATPALAVTAPAGLTTEKDTLTKGASSNITWTIGTAADLPVKIDIIKAADAEVDKAKAVATVSTKAATVSGDGTIAFTPSVKLASGDYIVRITSADLAVTELSDPFALVSAGIATVTPPSDATAGQTVSIAWTLTPSATDAAKVELFKAGVLVAKGGVLSKSTTATDGAGTVNWKIPTTLAAGSDYTIKVTSISDDTKTRTSSAFAVAAAPSATTTTTAAPTTTTSTTTSTTTTTIPD